MNAMKKWANVVDRNVAFTFSRLCLFPKDKEYQEANVLVPFKKKNGL